MRACDGCGRLRPTILCTIWKIACLMHLCVECELEYDLCEP